MTNKSGLRLFLSVDVAGSTALKERVNYQQLDNRTRFAERVLEAAEAKLTLADVLKQGSIVTEEEFDWASILQDRLNEFHAKFVEELRLDGVGIAQTEFSPWKAIGDELVYCFLLKTQEQCSRIVKAFVTALRKTDAKLAEGNLIRFKGSAWTAGFPIRNRVVELPMEDLYYRVPGRRSRYVPFPHPKTDYWGPDMDIGFRIGKMSFPGMCVASMDLVQVLGMHQHREQMRALCVGWCELKGVWGDRPYPIYWLDLPDGKERPTIRAWAEAESPFLREWDKHPRKAEAKDAIEKIQRIRADLPEHIGTVTPYIREAGDEVPEDHEKLLELLEYFAKAPSGIAGQGPQGDMTVQKDVPTAISGKLALPADATKATPNKKKVRKPARKWKSVP